MRMCEGGAESLSRVVACFRLLYHNLWDGIIGFHVITEADQIAEDKTYNLIFSAEGSAKKLFPLIFTKVSTCLRGIRHAVIITNMNDFLD